CPAPSLLPSPPPSSPPFTNPPAPPKPSPLPLHDALPIFGAHQSLLDRGHRPLGPRRVGGSGDHRPGLGGDLRSHRPVAGPTGDGRGRGATGAPRRSEERRVGEEGRAWGGREGW